MTHRVRIVSGIRLKRVARDAYDYSDRRAGRDYHIRREGGEWMVDAFDSGVKDPDEAHIPGASSQFDTLEDAVDFVKPIRGPLGLLG